jgi:hypothetical protein
MGGPPHHLNMLKNNENYSEKTMNIISRHKSQTPTLGKISKI